MDAVEAANGFIEIACFHVKLLKGTANAKLFAVRVAKAAADEANLYAGAYHFFFFIITHTHTHTHTNNCFFFDSPVFSSKLQNVRNGQERMLLLKSPFGELRTKPERSS
jgi:hypothetical protein